MNPRASMQATASRRLKPAPRPATTAANARPSASSGVMWRKARRGWEVGDLPDPCGDRAARPAGAATSDASPLDPASLPD